jgi:hypothetical protein
VNDLAKTALQETGECRASGTLGDLIDIVTEVGFTPGDVRIVGGACLKVADLAVGEAASSSPAAREEKT